jgi:DNA-binding NarL/FixJ family response regulator
VPIDVVHSTSEALAALDERHYAIVLSDLSRVEDGEPVPDAGLRLLAQMAPETPLVIYSKFESLPTAYRDRALDEGAVAVVSSSAEVWEWLRAVDLLP